MAMRHAIDLWPAAVILLDAGLDVVAANAGAHMLLARGPVMALRDGSLFFRRHEDQAAFLAAATQARDAPVNAARLAHAHFCLFSRQGSPALGLTLAASPGLPGGLLVIACDLIAPPAPDPATLSRMLAVTPAEARVAAGLAAGLSVNGLAARDGLSVHTVRDHVKRLLTKTGTSSQSQLVRLVVKLGQILPGA